MVAIVQFERELFHSGTVREWDHEHKEDISQKHNLRPRKVGGSSTSPFPHLALGFDEIDINIDGEGTVPIVPRVIGIKATTSLSADSFTSTVGMWSPGKLCSFGCTVLLARSPPEDPAKPSSVETGIKSINRTSSWTDFADPREGKYHDFLVKFTKEFVDIPEVVVWISGFQMETKGDFYDFGGTAVTASITNKGFTLRFISGADTTIFSAQLSWVALATDCGTQSGVCIVDEPQENYGDRTKIKIVELDEKYSTITQAFCRVRIGPEREGPGALRITLRNRIKQREYKGPALLEAGKKYSCEVTTWAGTRLGKTEVAWIAHK